MRPVCISWTKIFAPLLCTASVIFFQPLWATLGSPSGALWFASKWGIFVVDQGLDEPTRPFRRC